MQTFKLSALSLCFLIAAAFSFSTQAAPKDCNPVKTSNGITTFGNTGIKKISYEVGMNWGYGMATMQNFCEKNCTEYPASRVWRLPSRADMGIIGKCLDPKITYWTSERVGPQIPPGQSGARIAIAYRDGAFMEKNTQESGTGWAAIGISGGAPSELSSFSKLADAAITEYREHVRILKMDDDLNKTVTFYSDLMRTEMGADAIKAQRIAQQAETLGGHPKGTIWNCMSEVVPVNRSLNQVGFSCPNGGSMNMSLMQKYKWKITSTERIRAQAEDYRSDAYGMTNWNGSGVIISLMLEKQ